MANDCRYRAPRRSWSWSPSPNVPARWRMGRPARGAANRLRWIANSGCIGGRDQADHPWSRIVSWAGELEATDATPSRRGQVRCCPASAAGRASPAWSARAGQVRGEQVRRTLPDLVWGEQRPDGRLPRHRVGGGACSPGRARAGGRAGAVVGGGRAVDNRRRADRGGRSPSVVPVVTVEGWWEVRVAPMARSRCWPGAETGERRRLDPEDLEQPRRRGSRRRAWRACSGGPAPFICNCAARRRIAAGFTEPPGELILQYPICPRCNEEVSHNGGGSSVAVTAASGPEPPARPSSTATTVT